MAKRKPAAETEAGTTASKDQGKPLKMKTPEQVIAAVFGVSDGDAKSKVRKLGGQGFQAAWDVRGSQAVVKDSRLRDQGTVASEAVTLGGRFDWIPLLCSGPQTAK